jgi:protein gp37
MKTTKIGWTDKTWNPITGCTKHSAGYAHCYAEVMSRRLYAMGLAKYANGFQFTMHEDSLNEPKAWKKNACDFCMQYERIISRRCAV